jgi:hypothetical protein
VIADGPVGEVTADGPVGPNGPAVGVTADGSVGEMTGAGESAIADGALIVVESMAISVCAKMRPSMVEPFPTATFVMHKMMPENSTPTPSATLPATCQKIFAASAPFNKCTVVSASCERTPVV